MQLVGICLLALSLRDDASRRSIFLRSNLSSSHLSAAATSVDVAMRPVSPGNANHSASNMSRVQRRARGNDTFTAPGKNRWWKFKRFDLSAWWAAPKVDMGTDDAVEYFR